MTIDKLSHTTWKCKYHIVFAPKYRRQVVYKQIKKDIGKILRQLCDLKKVEILEAEACPDHISTELECVAIYGIFEREKFLDDL